MSRSYRKHAIAKDRHWSKSGKFMANKRIRQKENIPNKSGYKKFYESWDICDYHYDGVQTKEELKRQWDNGFYRDDFSTYKELYRHWVRYYKGK